MTRLEAIAILDGFKYNPLLNEQHFEALDMAVSALSESNEKCENMSDDPMPDDPKAEYKREYNFHRECLERIINRIDDSETFSAVDFYASEAMNILLKMRDCKYTNLGGWEP